MRAQFQPIPQSVIVVSAPVAQLDNVRVEYGKFVALDDISLRIPAGATGLVGRNGAGKSTLLRLLLGLIRPSRGRGQVLGADLLGPGHLLRRAVGYMPEADAFLPGLRGLEQVALAGELCGLAPREAIRRAHEVLVYVDLGEARYREVQTYSTGMRQRLKLAVALVHDPRLLLFDEPTVGLDPPNRQRMLELIADLVERHQKTVVLSTHLLGEIEHVCQTVIMIEQGQILAEGLLSEVLQAAADRYFLEWDGAADEFERALTRDGGDELVRDRQSLSSADANGHAQLKISMPRSYDARRFFQLAQQTGVRLRTLRPESEDLADLYHRLIGAGKGS